jgi:MmyB-like transcription regulator ligand binding domain/Helix-turn-helix domain
MDRQAEIRDFLMSRRARISPEEAGLPVYDGLRRVPGLRREEVAQAAAISVDYYNRLERGKVAGVSTEVLTAIARTLHLDDTEHDYLFGLFQSGPSATERRAGRMPAAVRPPLRALLDGLVMPAFIENVRLEMIGANHAGSALYKWLGDDFRFPFSIPRFIFLDPRSREFYIDWDRIACNTVALVRAQTGHDSDSPELLALIGQLAARSDHFRQLWAAHDVRRYREGPKRLRHPVVGDLEFVSETLDVAQDQGLTMLAYTVEPQSRTAEAMAWLGSWTATVDEPAAGGERTGKPRPQPAGLSHRRRAVDPPDTGP